MMLLDTSSIYLAVKKNRTDLLENACGVALSRYEFANIIWKEVCLGKRMTQNDGFMVYRHFQKVFRELRVISPDMNHALRLAVSLKISVYDAAFVQAALKARVPLVTEDKKLLVAASKLTQTFALAEISG